MGVGWLGALGIDVDLRQRLGMQHAACFTTPWGYTKVGEMVGW